MHIRPFTPDDVPGVAALWRYWFHDKVLATAPELETWARRVYVERPGGDPEVPSLVAEGDGGRVMGFLGVTTTPVVVDGAPGTLAGVFPSVVAPDAPTSVASLLLRKSLAGPQTLTVSDGGHVKFERIWEALGGQVAPTASLRWIKVLRPTELGARRVLARRTLGRVLAPVWRPASRGADALVRRARPWWFGTAWLDDGGVRKVPTPPVPFVSEALTPANFASALARVHARTRLRPDYADAYLTWLFESMRRVASLGPFEATLLIDPAGQAVGWWVAYLPAGGTARVFALDGSPRHLDQVVDHLFARADALGVGAITGRLDPRLRRPMAERGTFTHNGGSRQMVHARDARLLDDAVLGRLAFSRLDGENWYWWAIDAATVA